MKIQQLLVPILATGLSLIPQIVNAAPIQCYIGRGGSYQICDMQRKAKSQYLIVWPDSERTLIGIFSTPSGSYADVNHYRSIGERYGGGTRYPRPHYNNKGEWLCFHHEPGGKGNIDFCIAAPS